MGVKNCSLGKPDELGTNFTFEDFLHLCMYVMFIIFCFVQVVSNLLIDANTPRTNLAESMHHSWMAALGSREKVSLYDSCVVDMANALLQSAKQQAYLSGQHLGMGPTLETLIIEQPLEILLAHKTLHRLLMILLLVVQCIVIKVTFMVIESPYNEKEELQIHQPLTNPTSQGM